MNKRSIILLIVGILGFAPLWGQFPGSGSGNASSTPQAVAEADTFNFTTFYQHQPGQTYPFSDTLLDRHFEQFDPIRFRDLDYAHLGNLGSAHRQITYQPLFTRGLDIGFHQFDLYKIDYLDLPFYRLDKAFSDLYFTQGSTQQETYFKGKFSRNFANGLNFALDYKRINNIGKFKSQKSLNTNLAMGFWYQHPNKKYEAFFTYTSNTIDQENNGGIDTSLLTPNNTEAEFNFPVFIDGSSETRHVERQYVFNQYYRLAGKRDSITNNARSFLANHKILYQSSRYKFFDNSVASDSSYYRHLQLDNRGLRHFIRHQKIENTFWLSTTKSAQSEKEVNEKDLLRVGLTHSIHFIDQELNKLRKNNLFLLGEWNFSPSERLRINTYAHYGLWDNGGDYRLSGLLFFDLQKAGKFEIKAAHFRYAPTLLQNNFYVNEQSLWANDFSKTLETNLAFTYRLPAWRTSLSAQYHLINNFIYHDTLAFPRQAGLPLSILQFIVRQDFKLGVIHLDNTLSLQTISEDFLRLPSFYSKHSLYYEGKVFKKKMLFSSGFDLRLSQSYFGDYYQPLTSQFHLQDDFELPFYPIVDAFVSFKVQTFRFYIRAENLTDFLSDELYYQIPGYPHPYFNLRFGVSWRLLN